MKSTLVIILNLFSVFLYSQNTAKPGFTLEGNLTGFTDGTLVKLENANTGASLDSAKIIKGKFILKGKLDQPTLCWLKINGETQRYIYMEDKTIAVNGSKPIAKNLSVSGSSSHVDFTEFQKVFDPLSYKLQSAAQTINSLPYGKERDSLMEIYHLYADSIQFSIDAFVDQHKSSAVSPFVLSVTAQFYDDPVLLEARFNRLDQSVKNLPLSLGLKEFIEYNKIGAVGTKAVDFTQPDTSGIPVSLSSFKGKYVLVDFWASWCGPCRMENPNVVANYNKFKNKNFTVLGVSLDRPGSKQDWIGAIHKDNLTWTQVSDLQFWNNSAAKLYRVQGIPFNLLLDPDGKIIGRELRGPALEQKLCEVLGCN